MFSFLVVKILFFLEVVKAKAMMLLYTSGRRDHFKRECGDGKGRRPTLLRKVPYSLKRFFSVHMCVCVNSQHKTCPPSLQPRSVHDHYMGEWIFGEGVPEDRLRPLWKDSNGTV